MADDEAIIAGPLQLVAQDTGRTGAHVGSRLDDSDLEWQSRAGSDGSGLAARGLGRGEAGLVGPGQPPRGISKDFRPMLLKGDQIIEDIDPGIDRACREIPLRAKVPPQDSLYTLFPYPCFPWVASDFVIL